jgi:hypothetical protein
MKEKEMIWPDVWSWWGMRTNLQKKELRDKYFPDKINVDINELDLIFMCNKENINIESENFFN